jgi:flagellar hook-basal body complex protein FliE
MRVSAIANPALDHLAQAASPSGVVNGKNTAGNNGDFAQTLMDVLKEVNATQQDSVAKQKAFMTGQPVDYHDLMIAMEKASVALQLTMEVRNKLLEAYNTVSQMQV